MSKWPMVRLGDIITVTSGGTPKKDKREYYDNGTIPWVKTGDLKNRYLYSVESTITEKGLENSSAKMFPVGTVLLAMYGATIGACSILGIEASTNQACAALLPCEHYLDTYLYYYLNSIKNKLISLGIGGAQPNISGTIIKNLQIPLLPLPLQQKIVDVLNQASILIEKRKQQIETLDLLVKSKFVEMFGDPLIESPKWDFVLLTDVCILITDGTHQPPKFQNTGIPFLFVSNIVGNKLTYDTSKYLSQRDYDVLIARTPIEIGDILLTTVGSYGNPAIVLSDQKFCFQRHIAYIKPDQKTVNSYYLHSAFLSSYVKKQIEDGVKGIAQKTLNLSELKKFKVILPPIELQNKFAVFVEKVEQQKAIMQQHLDLLETNYKSLMQTYFG